MTSDRKGFTLIELIVVVGIIALISSVVLAAFSLARLRAQDAAVKKEMIELRTLMARQMADTGSYAAIKNGGTVKALNETCVLGNFAVGGVPSQYANEAKAVCDALVRASSANNACGSVCARFNAPSGVTRFSIEAYLPYESTAAGAPRYLCMGSSGRSSSLSDGIVWSYPGCSGDP